MALEKIIGWEKLRALKTRMMANILSMQEKSTKVSWLGNDIMSRSLRKNETDVEFRGAKKKKHSVAATQPKHNEDLDKDNPYGQTKS